jgi:uncharacterized protein YndB with AHSA1/START domain
MGVEQSAVEAPVSRPRGMRMVRSATATIRIDASPTEVWQRVADIRRQPGWSCEATSCEWIPPANQATAGARFRGRNRRGFRRWTRESEITEVEPGRTLCWRTLPSRLYPDSTDWRIELRPAGPGTEVRESYRIRSLPRGLEIFLYWFNPSHRERSADLEGDLRRLKDDLEVGSR